MRIRFSPFSKLDGTVRIIPADSSGEEGLLFGENMEKEPQTCWSVREITIEDGESSHELLKRLHVTTYENAELGISSEQIEERFNKRTPEQRHDRREQRIADNNNQAYVACDSSGKIIGMVAPRIEDDGTRRIGALYVDRDWQGKGLSHELMQKALTWHEADKNDVELYVVSYNNRAKAFYRKWGFEEIEGSDTLFDDLIPEIKMIRKAGGWQ